MTEEIRQKNSSLRSLQKETLSKCLYKMRLIWLNLLTSALCSSELITRFWNQKVHFSRKSSITFCKKVRMKTIPKKLFLTFPSMYFPIMKRISLRKVWIFVFHLSNLIMPTIWAISNCFVDISIIERFCVMRT